MPANLVFRRKIWGARDNGIPPRSTPESNFLDNYEASRIIYYIKYEDTNITWISSQVYHGN